MEYNAVVNILNNIGSLFYEFELFIETFLKISNNILCWYNCIANLFIN